MPVYILHGFRWPRAGFKGVRVYVILQDLEDVSAEYIQTPGSRRALLDSFKEVHPNIMSDLPKDSLTFIEPYNPDDLNSNTAVSQPFAYVADKVITMAANDEEPSPTSPATIKPTSPKNNASNSNIYPGSLGVNVEDVVAEGSGLSANGWEALADLRDVLAPGEKIGWWVVYNGDPERGYEDEGDEDDSEYEDEGDEGEVQAGPFHDDRSVTPTQGSPSSVRRKALPLRTKPRSTPLEEQKSPIKESMPNFPIPSDESKELPKKPPQKSLPPLPNQKPPRKASVPSTSSKPEGLKKKLFGRKGGP